MQAAPKLPYRINGPHGWCYTNARSMTEALTIFARGCGEPLALATLQLFNGIGWRDAK